MEIKDIPENMFPTVNLIFSAFGKEVQKRYKHMNIHSFITHSAIAR